MLKKTLWFIRTHLKHIIPENSPLFRMMAVYGMKIRARSAHEPLSTLAMGVFAVEHCNLNCKCCTTFSPIAEESLLNIETFRKDAAKLAEVCGDKVTTFYITGGEPLLHPQF